MILFFEISSELSTFSKHLGKELIEKIELKYKNGRDFRNIRHLIHWFN